MKSTARIWILASWLLGFYALAIAQPQQSANFRMTKSVLDASGGTSSSSNFHLVSVLGQPTPIGAQSSANFTLYAGFLSPTFSVSPLSPVQQLVILPQQPDVLMSWEAVPGAVQYRIYRSTDPSFVPGPASLLGTVATPSFTDANVIGLATVRNYYIVTALNSAGGLLSAAPSRQIGFQQTREEAPATKAISARSENTEPPNGSQARTHANPAPSSKRR